MCVFDRNDMELGTVVVLDAVSHPTDFGFKRVEVWLGIGLSLEFKVRVKIRESAPNFHLETVHIYPLVAFVMRSKSG